MNAYDHSQTYRSRALRNLPHRRRKATISRIITRLALPPGLRYADFGCSNGYLTSFVAGRIGARVTDGYDHNAENLAIARNRHPDIAFSPIDLNLGGRVDRVYDLITCFETLEHVGSPASALDTLVSGLAPSGTLLLSVPIEVGPVGIAKFLAKRLLYGYRLDEISSDPAVQSRYLRALIGGDRLGRFRDSRPGWGSHFGFDYRDLEDLIARRHLSYEAWSDFTTRFVLIRTQ